MKLVGMRLCGTDDINRSIPRALQVTLGVNLQSMSLLFILGAIDKICTFVCN